MQHRQKTIITPSTVLMTDKHARDRQVASKINKSFWTFYAVLYFKKNNDYCIVRFIYFIIESIHVEVIQLYVIQSST